MANPLYGQNKADTLIDDATTLNVGNYGMWEYYEVVDCDDAVDDNDVAASLSILIPAGAIIVEAAIVSHRLATSNHGVMALEVHNAAVADDAGSAGTEIVGEDVSGNVSTPDNDLDVSNDASVGAVIHLGTLANVDRSSAVSYFHVCAKDDQTSMTGTPQVGVYLKWFGPKAVAI